MKTVVHILMALFLVAGVRSEWSWGKNGKVAALHSSPDEQISEALPTAAEVDPEKVGRSIDAPDPLLPLEEHSSYAPVDELSQLEEEPVGDEGRSGRFLGISDKLCKLGVKGMCEETKGYPLAVPSHYGNSLGSGSSYTSYPPYSQTSHHGSHYPNANVLPPKPLKKLFSNLFNKKKLKGSAHQQTYGVPSQTYGAPSQTYGTPPKTYFPPSKGYSPPHTSYKQPANSYVHPKPLPTYSAPKPHYVKAKPHFPAPKPHFPAPKPHIPVYDTPKPHDVVIHKIKGQHSVPSHHISDGIHPGKVEHIHTHTHIYKHTPPFDIRDSPASFPRDDSSSYLSASQISSVIDRDSAKVAFASNPFPPLNTDPKDSFKPSQAVPFHSEFPSNQGKRHISSNGFPSEFGAKKQQTFQSSIDKLASSFASNGLQPAYPVDCQCVRREYCAPSDVLARTDSGKINNLLDARNQPSDVLSNTTFSDDYYEYDYLRTDSDKIYESANETNTTNPIYEDVDYVTEEIPTTTVIPEESKRVRRDVVPSQEQENNSTTNLQGRQLVGFTPGVNGCGHNHVCCRRPVYIAAKRAHAVCGRGNPSIHGRVSSFEFKKGQSDFGEYPWQAAILRDEGSESMFVCGATLIDGIHVLTAAHCVNDLDVESLKVRLGEWDVNRDTEFYKYIEIPVQGIFVHPEFYKGNLYNDIAILRLASYVDINANPHISPICLPPPNTDFTNYKCHVTGWGKDAFGDKGKFQHILKELEVPIVDHQTCEFALRRTRLGPEYKLHKGFICAGGEEGKDACKGDGGGPLVCSLDGKTFQLGGIVSWGIGCGQRGVPGVYVNIPFYVDWIKFTTRI